MIKNKITFAEMKSCIDEAIELCFEDGVYQPYMKDFAIWHRLAYYFTDKIKEGMSVDETYEILLDETLRDALIEKIQVKNIISAYLGAVNMRYQKEIRRTKLGAIIDVLLEAVTEKLENPETMEKLAEWAKELGAVNNEQENGTDG